MRLALVILVSLLMCSQMQAQATVEYGTKLQADSAQISPSPDGGVYILAEGLKDKRIPYAIITADVGTGWVFAYNRAKPFPPRTLPQVSPGKYMLDSPGVWDIQILPIVDGSGGVPTFLEGVKIGESDGDDGGGDDGGGGGDDGGGDDGGGGGDFSDVGGIIGPTIPDDPDTAEKLSSLYLQPS